MAINLDQLPKGIKTDLNERGFSDGEIAIMSASEAFEGWCEWHGIINWARRLEDTLNRIQISSPEWMKANAPVTMTYNDKGDMVAVTRRDLDDKVLATLWEKK